MAYTATQASTGFADRVAHTLSDIKARYSAYRTYRVTLTELQTLSDRELADLGLNASTLKQVAYEAAYKN